MFLMVQIAISTLFHIEFLVMKKNLLVILSFKNVGILVQSSADLVNVNLVKKLDLVKMLTPPILVLL